MRVEIVKDATVTVKAGQVVDIAESEVRAALALGLVKPYKETKKRGAAK